jgi:tetratricopeptide (TPR) repeat protein/predicted Ser/Thr protein kinase
MVGETISHYRLLERLGAGGMGEVYKAEDTRLHRPVAVKLLVADALRGEEARLRFLREAQAASALSHPNIATIYEIDEVERDGARLNFIVMEYVAGRTLKEQAQGLGLSEALEIVMQIADALAEAHARGVIHRDIKPSNVIIGESRRVKVLDFGIAKFAPLPPVDGETASFYHTELLQTVPGTVLGTYSYMSPEQALGREVDQRADIFSLGVLTYELLAGRPPFAGGTTLAVVDSILHADPPGLARFNPGVTPEIERIVRKMLEKDRGRRYQSLREVYLDLDAARGELTGSGATNSGYGTRLFGPGGTTTAGPRTLGARAGKSIAVMTFSNITQDAADDWLGVGIAETVTADLKSIEGATIIGRERIHEAVRQLGPGIREDPDEKLATRVGREIGARWIVTGGYQRLGGMLRITARFVDVETGEVVKTVKIDGGMGEIFALQDKIVYELSRDLDLSLRSGERQVIEQEETQVIEAYEAFAKGMMNLRALSREALDRAAVHFEKAIALDPRYARAHAALGFAFDLKASILTMPELSERAIAQFQKAIELNPLLADGYAGLGLAFLALGRDDEAIGAIRRALTFAPDDFMARSALARAYFIGKGKFREAAAEYEKALGANPVAGWVALQLSQCYAYLGEYERGEQIARQAIALQEKYLSGREGMQVVGAFARLGYIYYRQGRYDDAIAEYYRELVFLRQTDHGQRERMSIEVHQKLGSAYVRQGNHDDARRAYDQVTRGFEARLGMGADDPFTRYYVACAAAMAGETARALESLEKAAEGRRCFTVERARREPDLESLREDPRFRALAG